MTNSIIKIIKYVLKHIFKLDVIKRPIDDIEYRNQKYILALLNMRLPFKNYQQEDELKFINFCRINGINVCLNQSINQSIDCVMFLVCSIIFNMCLNSFWKIAVMPLRSV